MHLDPQDTQNAPREAPPHSLVLHLSQSLANGRVFDVGVCQGLQDVLLGSQVLLQVDLDLVILLQLLLKEFLARDGGFKGVQVAGGALGRLGQAPALVGCPQTQRLAPTFISERSVVTKEVVMSSFWIISRSCCSRDMRWSRISCTFPRIRFRFCSTCLSSAGTGRF